MRVHGHYPAALCRGAQGCDAGPKCTEFRGPSVFGARNNSLAASQDGLGREAESAGLTEGSAVMGHYRAGTGGVGGCAVWMLALGSDETEMDCHGRNG
jgi:hypothetical protein